MFCDQSRQVVRAKRWSTSQHLVEHRTETVDISTRVELLTAALFRRHVVERSDNRAGVSQCGRRRYVAYFRETEVHDLRCFFVAFVTRRSDDDVVRLIS